MAKFEFNMDEHKCHYELVNGDKYDFFKIVLREDEKEITGLINVHEAQLLIVALQQYIETKKPRQRTTHD